MNNKIKKHDCEEWYEEGLGCSICSKILIRMSKEDIKKIQQHCNAYILDLKTIIEKALNRLGSPTMSYCQEIENKELKKTIQDVFNILKEGIKND